MFTIGLTGGSGCGKGYVSKYFKEHGFECIDTDAVSRVVTQPGQKCLLELIEAFGEGILNEDGTLARRRLGEIVFSDKEKLSILNKITHKHILSKTREWLSERENNGDFAAVIDAPVLFESCFNVYCDYTVGVVADTECRIERIIKRDGISRESAEKRIAAQKPNSFYIEVCDFIIYNGCTVRQPQLQVDLICQQIRWA